LLSREIIKPNATILLILINIGIFIYSLSIPEQTLSSLIFKPEQLIQLKRECGDVLWYIANLCSDLEFNLNEVAIENIEKLFDRKDRDVLNICYWLDSLEKKIKENKKFWSL